MGVLVRTIRNLTYEIVVLDDYWWKLLSSDKRINRHKNNSRLENVECLSHLSLGIPPGTSRPYWPGQPST